MDKCVEEAKKLIEKQVANNGAGIFGKAFSEYQKGYFWTNENINGYMSQIDFNNKNNALSVLSSGDHTFNLIHNGIYNIDTFDTNRLTEYFALGLKRAMIMKCSYKDFLSAMQRFSHHKISLDEITQMIVDLLPFMDLKYRNYWKEISSYNYKLQKDKSYKINLLYMLCMGFFKQEEITFKNNYLQDEESYNKLKNEIVKANITFKCADAFDLAENFAGKYDFIILSNILDYFFKYYEYGWQYEQLKEYKEKLLSITKEEGIIFLNYLFNYSAGRVIRTNVITASSIHINDLTDEEIISFPKDLLSTKAKDGMFLVKKI